MPKLTKRQVILIKIEPTPGTDSVPVASTDAVKVSNLNYSFADAKMSERNPHTPAFGRDQPVYGGSLIELTFDVELKGASGAGVAPELGVPLRACGYGQTIVGGTSVTYAQVSTALEYVSIYFYEDGTVFKCSGMLGAPDFSMTTGEPGMISMTFKGHLDSHTTATLVTPTHSTIVPPAFIGATFVTGGYASIISAFAYSPGNVISAPIDANSADGFGLMYLSDRDPGGSFDPEAVIIATDDPIADWKAGTSKAIGTGVVGATAGNRWALTVATAFYKEVGPGERDGARTLELGYLAAGGDAACSLAFT